MNPELKALVEKMATLVDEGLELLKDEDADNMDASIQNAKDCQAILKQIEALDPEFYKRKGGPSLYKRGTEILRKFNN